MAESRSAFKFIISKPTRKILLGRLKRRLEENIRMNLKEIGAIRIGLIRLRIGIIRKPL